MIRYRYKLVAVFLILSIAGKGQFKNITQESGILHAHESPILMGGGVDIADYNNDGWEDLYFTGGQVPDRLYLNLGNGAFENQSGLIPNYRNESTISSGVVSGDLNNDGCQDIVLATLDPSSPNFVFRNHCDGTFSKIELKTSSFSSPCIGSVLVDFDRDGLLDIYIIGYVENSRFFRDEDNVISGYDHDCARNYLFKNKGDFQFEEVTDIYGVAGMGCSLAVGTSWIEENEVIYIANDFGEWIHPNELFLYDSDSTKFREAASQFNLDVAVYGMGIAVGDYDNDLDLDLYVTNLGQNPFLRNDGGSFSEISLELGVDNTYIEEGIFATSWGCFFFDCDNDGDLDLYVANGYIATPPFLTTYFLDPNKLYIQQDDKSYLDFSNESKLDFTGINRGAAYGDLDLDGDLDIVLANIVQGGFGNNRDLSYQVFENQFEKNHFLQIKLEGVTNNRDGFGSRVLAHHCGGTYLQYLYSGGTYASQNSKIVHFGLAECEIMDSIEVIWPNGLIDVFYNIPADQRILVREGAEDYLIIGCMDPAAPNYNPLADVEGGCSQEMTTSIEEENLLAEQIKIYPTITDGKLEILSEMDLGECRLEVFDHSGNMHFRRELDLHAFDPNEIQLNGLANGMYYMKIISKELNGTGMKRFIIQNE